MCRCGDGSGEWGVTGWADVVALAGGYVCQLEAILCIAGFGGVGHVCAWVVPLLRL